ncbi:MAG: radical SAM protein [Aquificaceae bacterium]
MRLLQELNSELNRLFLFELPDHNRVEAVFYRGDTLCISTQVGCAIGCPFCLSGSGGLLRNLTLEEILDQYRLLKDRLSIKRIAVAGIGEPLMNWERVKEAFWYFKSMGLKVSFYTTGHPTKNLIELLRLPHKGVSISLHSTEESKRKKLLPHAGTLEELIKTLKGELKKLPQRKKKKISLAYLLLKGINHSLGDLKELARLAKELEVSVTLLRYNSTVEGYQDVGDLEYEKAFLLLRSYGVRVTLSTRFRRDRLGGCGTLLVNRELIGC